MQRYKIELVTMGDIRDFVREVSGLPGEIRLSNDQGFCVNAKSILGAVATVEWNRLYCYSENDIGEHIARFCVEEQGTENTAG